MKTESAIKIFGTVAEMKTNYLLSTTIEKVHRAEDVKKYGELYNVSITTHENSPREFNIEELNVLRKVAEQENCDVFLKITGIIFRDKKLL